MASPLNDWLPSKFALNDQDELEITWKYFANKMFLEPFFDETIGIINSYPENSKRFQVITDDSILKNEFCNDHLYPDVFIFHTSRCGSTALTQALSQIPQNIAVSEYGPLDFLLRRTLYSKPEGVEYEELIRKIYLLIDFLGQKRNPDQNKFILKLDSWHLYFAPLLRKLYPNTPFVFLYRNPEEIKFSQQKLPGMHAVPNLIEPQFFNIKNIEEFSFHNFIDQVLESYYEQMSTFIKNNNEGVYLFNYSEGMPKIIKDVFGILDIYVDQNTQEKVNQRMEKHSKDAFKNFVEESILITVSTSCLQQYEILETIRKEI